MDPIGSGQMDQRKKKKKKKKQPTCNNRVGILCTRDWGKYLPKQDETNRLHVYLENN